MAEVVGAVFISKKKREELKAQESALKEKLDSEKKSQLD